MTTLISFLGRAQADPETGYRTTRYRFPDGSEKDTPFFGLALRQHLGADRLVIIGTPGSMWDVLVEHLARHRPADYEDPRLALQEAVERQAVDEELLHRLRPLMAEHIGVPVEPLLIGYGRDLDEQQQLLDRLAESVAGEGRVHFDITHGLRHLAMLAQVAAHLLEALSARLRVEAIWYGAFELKENGITPAIRLDGLLRLQQWIDAWRRFQDDGDYSVFADLLEREGLPVEKVAALRRAAHFEAVLNLPEARRQLLNFLPLLDQPLPGAARLFGRRLRERLDWVRKDDLYQHQRRLAQMHLRKGDYLRCAILAVEAVLTRRMAESGEGDPNRYPDRQRAREALKRDLQSVARDRLWRDYRRLEYLRNALAHATAPDDPEISKLLRNPERLPKELESLLSRLLT